MQLLIIILIDNKLYEAKRHTLDLVLQKKSPT